MYVPIEVTRQPEIAAGVHDIVNGMSSHIVGITFQFDTDWSGDWGIFFHIILRDEASSGAMLGQVANETRRRLTHMLRELGIGLIAYTNFRSESEVAELQRQQA